MKIEQLMTRPVWTCNPRDGLDVAAKLMWDHDVGCVVVQDAGRTVGVITDRDICMGGFTTGLAFHEIQVGRSMTIDPCIINARATIDAAERLMRHKRIRRLPVVNDAGALVGLLSLNDVAREAARQLGKPDLDVSSEGVAATLAVLCTPHESRALLMREPATTP